MNIIFLDINGVLDSVDTAIANNSRKKGEENNLDPISIGLVRRLCLDTNSKIVISSTWRKTYSLEELISVFERYDWPEFKDIYHGCTPVVGSRGKDINEYINNIFTNGSTFNYVILDDDSDMLEYQLDNFVHVSNINGFRSKHYCKALRIFGMPDERLEQQVNFVRKTTKGE